MKQLEMALNPLDRYKGTRKPDEVRKSDVAPASDIPDLELLIRKYEQNIHDRTLRKYGDAENYFSLLRPIVTEVLTPSQINKFLQYTIKHDSSNMYNGVFVTLLIQNSYNNNHNNFFLDSKALTYVLQGIGYKLKGKKQDRINLTINGDVGCGCGEEARELNLFAVNAGAFCGEEAVSSRFTITGNVEEFCGRDATFCGFNIGKRAGNDCGNSSRYSVFLIGKSAGVECGHDSTESKFDIKGGVAYECGTGSRKSEFTILKGVGRKCGDNSVESTFTIHGEIKRSIGMSAAKATFTAYSQESYDTLQRHVEKKHGNTIVLLERGTNRIIEERIL